MTIENVNEDEIQEVNSLLEKAQQISEEHIETARKEAARIIAEAEAESARIKNSESHQNYSVDESSIELNNQVVELKNQVRELENRIHSLKTFEETYRAALKSQLDYFTGLIESNVNTYDQDPRGEVESFNLAEALSLIDPVEENVNENENVMMTSDDKSLSGENVEEETVYINDSLESFMNDDSEINDVDSSENNHDGNKEEISNETVNYVIEKKAGSDNSVDEESTPVFIDEPENSLEEVREVDSSDIGLYTEVNDELHKGVVDENSILTENESVGNEKIDDEVKENSEVNGSSNGNDDEVRHGFSPSQNLF